MRFVSDLLSVPDADFVIHSVKTKQMNKSVDLDIFVALCEKFVVFPRNYFHFPPELRHISARNKTSRYFFMLNNIHHITFHPKCETSFLLTKKKIKQALPFYS